MFTYMKRGKAFYGEITRLAIPIILQNLVTTSLGLIDTFMVGTLGETPLAAVSLANIPIFVVLVLIFGLQSGSSVLISQFWGKEDRDSISRVIGIGCYIAGAITLLFALVMTCFPAQLMGLLSNDPSTVAVASEYARIVGPSYLFNSITGVYVGAHRSMGNPKLGLVVFSISMCANTFLNWIFIFGNLGAPALGVVGAAVATLSSRVLEFVVMAVYALNNRRFRLNFQALLRPGQALLFKYIHYAAPVVCNELLWGLGSSMFKVVMGHMEGSTSILAARAVAGNIEELSYVVVFAIAGSAAIVVGREIGAGRSDTVYEIGATMNTLAFLFGGGICVFLLVGAWWVLPQWVYPLFQLSETASAIASMMLTFVAVSTPFRAFTATNIVGVLRGGGDVRAAMYIDLIPLWLISIPLSALFGLGLQWGIFWVYVGIESEQFLKFFWGLHRFRSRAWINDVTVLKGRH